VPPSITDALDAYFAGDVWALDGLPTDSGGSPFQRAVWKALRTVPAGAPVSYGWIAAAIDRPDACRAVGAANGANPVAVVVPCHRVIGADGRLTGFGGGLDRKLWLLRHEERHAGRQQQLAL
jgi:methylated-DNA-[protein]-cysteine S-methyltransferase